MNILHSPRLRAMLPPTIFWMRMNRVLAWALIVAPFTQWALGTRLVNGLMVEVAIFVAHAALSLALFGLPKATSRRATTTMLLFGRRPAGQDARNAFLLNGYRIGLTSLLSITVTKYMAMGLAFAMGSAIVGLPIITLMMIAMLVIIFWPIVRSPLTLVQHLYPAIVQALQRWGVRDGANALAALIVVHYFVLSTIKMYK